MTRFFTAAIALLGLFVLSPRAEAQVDIQEVTSPGGITAWLVQDNSIPFLSLSIMFQGGATLDRAEARGATAMMTGLLGQGAGDLDAAQFGEATGALATYFSYNAYRDAVEVTADMLTQNREEAAALLRLSLVEPRFDANAIERARAQQLSTIASNAQDPSELAWARMREITFESHPYAYSTQGSEESVAALTRDDLIAAHRALLTRDHLSVGASGDITPEELGLLLDQIFGDLPETGAPLVGEAPYAAPGGIEVVEFPSPQTNVAFVQPGISRDDPDFFPAFVMMRILGAGGFQSRLTQAIRVERGLTYGVSAWLSLADYRPTVQGHFSSSNDLVAEAVEVLRAEWQRMAEEGVTEEELADAQRYLTGAYPLNFVGNSNIAGILAGMQSDGMPIDYVNTRNDRIMAVTVAEVNRVAAELLDPEGLQLVLVGQPEGVELPE